MKPIDIVNLAQDLESISECIEQVATAIEKGEKLPGDMDPVVVLRNLSDSARELAELVELF